MTARVNAWVTQYSAVIGRVMAAQPSRRAGLHRELLQLSERRDRVLRLLDELATAGDAEWEDGRRQIEKAWRDVQVLTARVARRAGA